MKVFTRLCYLVLMITISITSVQSQIGIIEPFAETSFTPEAAPPANDNCANATTIMASTVSTCDNAVSGTTAGATNSSDYGCTTYHNEVWYAFTPATTGSYIFEITLTSGSSSTYISVWSGTCGSLTSLKGCNSTSVSRLKLTGGTTYLVSVGSYYSSPPVDFDVCIAPSITPSPPPPPNDDCSTAYVFNESLGVNGTVISATSWFGYPDVWYVHTPSRSQFYSVWFREHLPLPEYGNVLTIYTGSCDSLVEYHASRYSIFKDHGLYFPDVMLLKDQTYFFRVSSSSGDIDFDLSVNPITPPSNDSCANPIEIKVSEDYICDVNIGPDLCTPSLENKCLGDSLEYRPDNWFKFTPTESGTYTIDNNGQVSIYSGSCSNLELVVDCNKKVNFDLEADSTYLLCLSANYFDLWRKKREFLNTLGAPQERYFYFLCMRKVRNATPINTTCNSPIEIWNKRQPTSSNGMLYSSATATTPIGRPPQACYYENTHSEEWFSLENIVPGDEITVTVDEPSFSFKPAVILYEIKGDCGQLKQVACTYAGGLYNFPYAIISYTTPRTNPLRSFLVRVMNRDYDPRSASFKITASVKVNKLGPNKRAEPAVTDPGNLYFRVGQQVLNVYPVPTLDILQVQVASTEATDATLEILDLSGKVLHLENLRLEEGTYDYELDLSSLMNGTYLGRLNDQVFKVVVQK